MTLQQAMTIVGAKIPLTDDQVKARLNRAYDIVRQNGSGYTMTKSIAISRYSCEVCDSDQDCFDDYCSEHPHASIVCDTRYKWHIHKASTSLFDDSSAFYTVDSQGCNCPDALRCRAGLCKHTLATMLMIEMEKI